MDVGRFGHITADVFEKKIWFGKVEILGIDQSWVWVRNSRAVGHFEEAVEDEEE
jgi:hypothetical protein